MKTPTRQARRDLTSDDIERREAVRGEIAAIGAAQITDVMSWQTDEAGNVVRVNVVPSSDLSERARRSIKRVKVTPTQFGNQVEVEMHDKISALRLLAKVEGLTGQEDEQDKRPSLVGINLRGPKEIEGETDGEGSGE